MRTIHITTLFFCLLLLCACQNETEISATGAKKQTPVHISLSVCSELDGNDSRTRASDMMEPVNSIKNFNDKDIIDLWVVQTIDGKVETKKYFTNIQSKVSDDTSTEILSSLKTGKSEIWFVANTGSSSLFSNVTSLPQLKEMALNVAPSDPEGSLAVNGYLRAVGCWNGEVLGNGLDYIAVSLAPLAAKLTVDYEITGCGDGYGFESMQLMNVPMSMHYCTTTSGTNTENYSTTNYALFDTSNSNAKQKGRLVYYVTENIPGISGGDNTDPRQKSLYGKDTKAMYLYFQGRSLYKGQDIPFNVTLYPGENTTNDFNVKINHNYHISLSIDASNGPNNWSYDSRIDVVKDISLPATGNLEVWYEFSDEDKVGQNSLYDTDGTTLLPADGKYLRNLAGEKNTYSTERLTYGISDSRQPEQTYTEGTNYMSYSNCSINTGFGDGKTSSDAFTIIYIGGSGQSNGLGWSVYGPTNYGNRQDDPTGEKDGRRWYLVVNNQKQFQYGSQSTLNTTIPNFNYIFDKDDPYIIFSADKNTPNEGFQQGGTRDILLDNVTAQVLNVDHYPFTSNFYVGCNKWESGWVTQKGRLYLFLIYNKTLSTEEINQIRIYALYKGFLKHQLPN